MTLQRLAGPGLLLIISILFHWKLVLTNQYTWLEAGDIGSLIMPWFQFQAGEWHHWRFPMWDPYSWAGQPLFGQAQPGAAYPINWLLFWMPLDHGWLRQDVLHWWYVLVHYLAGLTAYALCRDLNRSRLASVLGGIVYSLAGYVASIDSPQMLQGAIWAPLVFLFLFRAERGVVVPRADQSPRESPGANRSRWSRLFFEFCEIFSEPRLQGAVTQTRKDGDSDVTPSLRPVANSVLSG